MSAAEWAGPARSYRQCSGARHWGPAGAAGVLLYTEVDGTVYVLLTLRSPHVQQGSTWSVPGGAIERGESPEQAAVAEAREELEGVGRMEITGSYRAGCPHGCGWAYTTFLAHVSPQTSVRVTRDRRDSWETSEVAWFPVGTVSGEPHLHPAFAAAWPELEKKIS